MPTAVASVVSERRIGSPLSACSCWGRRTTTNSATARSPLRRSTRRHYATCRSTRTLRATGRFEAVPLAADEAEHSMELHLPYIAKLIRGRGVTVVPILVGALSTDAEAAYGVLLAPYLADPSNFFSVSSDFCHWGTRFGYTRQGKKGVPTYAAIEELDRREMAAIEAGDAAAFAAYLRETENTICGRHPIAVLLQAVSSCRAELQTRFVRYEQSSRCRTLRDSSVSYASAVTTISGGITDAPSVAGNEGSKPHN
eukprot:SM000036S13245  [mRNA]  locus=s36:126461:127792:+ [translate_table: standard]